MTSSPPTARCVARRRRRVSRFADLVGATPLRPQARPQGAAQGPGHLYHRRQVAAAARRAGQVHGQPRLHAGLRACRACCTRRVIRPPAIGASACLGRRDVDQGPRRSARIVRDQGSARRRRRGRMDRRARRPRSESAMERRVGPARTSRSDRHAACRSQHHCRDTGQARGASARRARKARRRSRPAISGRCRATPRSARRARWPTSAPTPRRCGRRRRARMAIATLSRGFSACRATRCG